MRHNALVILGILLTVSLAGCASTSYQTYQTQSEALVTKVIDGDTVELSDGQKVRLLGINAPEQNEFYYQEAKERLIQLIGNKSVKLERGPEDKDIYERLLRYVFVDKDLANLQLVKEGYATVYILNPDEKYYLDFKKAEQDAREGKLGIWKGSTINCIKIVEFQFTGEEFVKFQNDCGYAINMDGWEIKDEATHIYVFNEFTFNSNSVFTLFTGYGSSSQDQLYWNSRSVWNNDGDTLFLRDSQGNLVLSYSY